MYIYSTNKTNTTGCSKKKIWPKSDTNTHSGWAKSDYSWKFWCYFHGITAIFGLFNLQFASFSQIIIIHFQSDFLFSISLDKFPLNLFFTILLSFAQNRFHIEIHTNMWISHFGAPISHEYAILEFCECWFSYLFDVNPLWKANFDSNFFNLNTNSNLFCLLKSLFVLFPVYFFFRSFFSTKTKKQNWESFHIVLFDWLFGRSVGRSFVVFCFSRKFSHWIKPFDWVTSYTLSG